jgi:hypothetical protein
MSRAQERSTGLQPGAQATQQDSGNVTGTSGNMTGATSTGMRDQPATRTETTTTYARDTGTTASYGQAQGSQVQASSGSTSTASAGGVMSMVAGVVAFLAGLAMVVRQAFYPAQVGYAYRWTIHGWGWALLILGALLFATGAIALLGMGFGRFAAAGIAALTAITGFLILPYTPIWATIVIALSVIAIWGLLRGGEGGGQGSGGYSEGSMGSGSRSSPTHRA